MKPLLLLFTVVITGGVLNLFPSSADRLQPSDLTYLGAFRLPSGTTDIQSWGWGGYAMTYYPNGDPSGPSDGHPGSLFGTGHAWEHQVSEISIPVPVNSVSKNLAALNTAGTIQSFRNIYNVGSLEMPRIGMAYMDAQGSQSSGKIYFCIGQHLNEEEDFMTHGWHETTLASPQTQGRWYLNSPYNTYNTNDIMFDIPTTWAATHTGGKTLGTGRFRDGGWSGQGPALFAIAPWTQGNPPPTGTSLQYKELLRYDSSNDCNGSGCNTMTDYHHSDEWAGGAWLTAGSKHAVIFVGTKGTGDCWYGDSNGPCLDCAGERGWWSTGFEGRIIFYDPDQLAAVAAGSMEAYEPQPYAYLNIDQYLYHLTSTQQWYHTSAAAFDRENGYLYVFEPYADGDKPIVHVWQVTASGGGGGGGDAVIKLNRSKLYFGGTVSGQVSPAQTILVENDGSGTMNWSVYEAGSWLSCSPGSGSGSGDISVSVNSSGLAAGQYSAVVSISSSEADNSPQSVTVYLTVYSATSTSEPIGQFATPADNAQVSSSIPVTGWVVDDIGIVSVKLYRGPSNNRVYIGDAVFAEGARPDVEIAYPNYPAAYKAGWGYMLLTNFLPSDGSYQLTVTATDVEGHRTELGTRTITVNNAAAVKPFGALDTPAQGGIASGSSYINWGWALTPMPNSIPFNGSTIRVWIDGEHVGSPTYNLYRSDIAGLFPGYANSNGAVGYYIIDTTQLENGIHTIQWTVTDSGGNTDGIGSRYFMVRN